MGTPNLNLVYEDEVGIVVDHFFDGKHVIHSELKTDEPSMEDLKHAQTISMAIDEAFKAKGIDTIYTWGETKEHDRYNKFLGYIPTGKEMNETFVMKDYPYPVMEYKKELK